MGDVEVLHHVQDGGSTDGTVKFLQEYASRKPQAAASNLTFASGTDEGMYDALNRGIDYGLGFKVDNCQMSSNPELQAVNCDDSVVAWLNCDEQYLPGTLEKVVDYFNNHPTVDFVYGDTLLLNPEGELLTYRKNPPLRKVYIQSDHLYIQSSSLFFRKKIFQDGHRFDTRWKAVSDSAFVLRLLDQGYKPGRIANYLSVFAITGENLSDQSVGWDELDELRKEMPLICRKLHHILRGMRCVEKWMRGGYRQKFPLEYSIYTAGNTGKRECISSSTGTFRFVSWERA